MNSDIFIPKPHWRATSLLVSIGMLFSSVAPYAQSEIPQWWQDRSVIDAESAEQNSAVANLGQAKWMATQALAELQSVAPALAANINLTQVFPAPPAAPDAAWFDAQKSPLNLGQLKAISHQFYDALPPAWLADQALQNGIIPWVAPYPWDINTPVEENLKLANIGQLKAVFSLRFRQDKDNAGAGDSLPDVWEQKIIDADPNDAYQSLADILHGDDFDGDGLENLTEYRNGTSPLESLDSNVNGVPDDWEVFWSDQFSVYPKKLTAQLTYKQNSSQKLYLTNPVALNADYSVSLLNNIDFGKIAYQAEDSITGQALYVWNDISATGQLLTSISNADDAVENIELSQFSFPFYGTAYSEVFVNSNGLIMFGTGSSAYSNQPIPAAGNPNLYIAPFWDDLSTDNTGSIYYKEEINRLIVQFEGVTRYLGAETYTFQAVLHDSGKIEFFYKKLAGDVESATVGVEGERGESGLQLTHNAIYLQDQLAVSVTPKPLYLISVSPLSGTLNKGEVLAIDVTINSFDLAPGVYNADIQVAHTGTGISPWSIPTTLEVTNPPTNIELTSPEDGAVFWSHDSFYFRATATDDDFGIEQVEFYTGETKRGEDASPSYNYRWDTPIAGDHVLTAKAVDRLGATTVSEPIHIRVLLDSDADQMEDTWEAANGLDPTRDDANEDLDNDGANNRYEYDQSTLAHDVADTPANEATTISITEPNEGEVVLQGDNLAIRAMATDSDTGVDTVEFHYEVSDGKGGWADETLLYTDSYSSWYYYWNTSQVSGHFRITAVAIDDYGHRSAPSAPVTVTILADSDEDLMADSWEMTHFGNLNTESTDDTDSDGYTNQEEYQFDLDPNATENSDTDDIPDGWEYHNGLDLLVDDSEGDLDNDGLSNVQEYLAGTKANNSDTDGDQLPDAWEVGYSLNPLSGVGVDGADGDIETDVANVIGDGLTNFDEYLYGSNPRSTDSDGDSVDDKTEVEQASDPGSSEDNGDAPDPELLEEVTFRIGDPSGSNSENWIMNVKGIGDEADTRTLKVKGKDFGVMSDPQAIKLYKGKEYEITVKHLGTKPPEGDQDQQDPDYDWEATIDGLPSGVANAAAAPLTSNEVFMVANQWIVDNREVVFTKEKHGNNNNIVAGKKAYLRPVGLVPDYNRDGVIDDKDRGKVTKKEPFRWWVNDDNDSGEIGTGDVSGSSTPDYDSAAVDGMRDLVDFFPLHLDIRGVLEVFPEDEYHYVLTHAHSAFKFFHDGASIIDDEDGSHSANSFLTQLSRAQAFANATVYETSSTSGGRIHLSYLSAAKEGKGVLLLEAKQATDQPLVLEVRKTDGTVMFKHEFPVKISKVEDMFRSANMRGITGGRGGLTTNLEDPGNPYPDTLTNGDSFVFLHGYNVPAEAARGWHAEVFKRMHQMGSKARFIGISWHGDTGKDYHAAVKNAFVASKQLKAWLQGAQNNGDITIAAHSLGNMLVSNAIEHEGLTPARYFMINAASPIEAYDPAQTTNSDGTNMETHMTESSWQNYNRKLYASNWHELFDSTDGRSKLKWKGIFATKVPAIAYNFYSTGEDVVKNARPNESVGNHTIEAIKSFNVTRYAWVAQEIAKGNSVMQLTLLPNTHAGWRFNYTQHSRTSAGAGYWKIPPFSLKSRMYNPTEAALITEAQLKIKPFHWPYSYPKLYDPQLGSAEANIKEKRHKLLAAEIPTNSFAAAANEIEELVRKGNENFNMMTMKNGDWPRNHGDWFHSDFRDVALSYVVAMYKKMITEGKLDK